MSDQRRQILAKALLGQGMAGRAGNNLQTTIPNYREYVIEAQTRGQPAIPPSGQWMQHFQELMGQKIPPTDNTINVTPGSG